MKHTQKGSVSDIGFILIIMLGLFILWVWAGGPNRQEANQGPFIKPLTDPKTPGEVYGPADFLD